MVSGPGQHVSGLTVCTLGVKPMLVGSFEQVEQAAIFARRIRHNPLPGNDHLSRPRRELMGWRAKLSEEEGERMSAIPKSPFLRSGEKPYVFLELQGDGGKVSAATYPVREWIAY